MGLTHGYVTGSGGKAVASKRVDFFYAGTSNKAGSATTDSVGYYCIFLTGPNQYDAKIGTVFFNPRPMWVPFGTYRIDLSNPNYKLMDEIQEPVEGETPTKRIFVYESDDDNIGGKIPAELKNSSDYRYMHATFKGTFSQNVDKAENRVPQKEHVLAVFNFKNMTAPSLEGWTCKNRTRPKAAPAAKKKAAPKKKT